MRTLETTVYKFDELSETAKEKAREWFRDGYSPLEDVSTTFDDFANIADILGIDLRNRRVNLMGGGYRYDPEIYYSGFWSQGDGASFVGSWKYNKGCSKAIRSYAPKNEELHRIADALAKESRPYFYRVRLSIEQGRLSNHYSHSGTMSIDFADYDGLPEQADPEPFAQLMRDFADWMYASLEREYEWGMADEQVDDNIRANEYEFDEDGARA